MANEKFERVFISVENKMTEATEQSPHSERDRQTQGETDRHREMDRHRERVR